MISIVVGYLALVLLSFIARVKLQACDGIPQYDQCSRNPVCTCLHRASNPISAICVDRYAVTCSELVACDRFTKFCNESHHICVHHPRCNEVPVCYPVSIFNSQFCAPVIPTTTSTITPHQIVLPEIPADARWAQDGITVAGGNGYGESISQLQYPWGLFIDDDQTIVIADYYNHRIIEWRKGNSNGNILAGGNQDGYRLDQLNEPVDVLIDKKTENLIICDQGNRRVMCWSSHNNTSQGESLLDNISCSGLAMDDQRNLYISDEEKHEIIRYQLDDKNRIRVVGGHGQGSCLDQLSEPRYLFVDRQQTIYVSDYSNQRVVKWEKNAKEGIIVAGDQGYGDALNQLANPNGIFVDASENIFIADSGNNRVVRWHKEARHGIVVVGGKGEGSAANQFHYLRGLSFDHHGNMYVVDYGNHRVQRFSIR